MPRGLTAIATLREAGVNVAAGADNLQDPFNPVGRACPFETAGLMVMAAHDLPVQAWQSVSSDAATVMGRRAEVAAGRRRRPDRGAGRHRPRSDRLRPQRPHRLAQRAQRTSITRTTSTWC